MPSPDLGRTIGNLVRGSTPRVAARQGFDLSEKGLNLRADFEEMRRRVEVGIEEIPIEQWPVITTEAIRLLAGCLSKNPYKVVPDIPLIINHGIIEFREERRGQETIYLLTPDMFRVFAAYHWTKLWSSNNLQARVKLARQMLGERNPLAALLSDPVYDRRNSSDGGRKRQSISHSVTPVAPIFVSYQQPETGESQQPTPAAATESPAAPAQASEFVQLDETVVFDARPADGNAGLATVGRDEESEGLREEITLEGAEARADGRGKTPKRKKDSELSEEKRREIIGKIPQIGNEELEKARAWNRQTIERYMESLSNQTDVIYNKSKALAIIAMFIAQASRRSLEKFDPKLENLMEFQLKRALGICLLFIVNHRGIGDLAKLFEVTKGAVGRDPFYFWENPVRES